MRFLQEIRMMRLVWAVIPLVLVVSMIGIVGIQESFAEYSDEGNIQEKEITTIVQKTVDGKPVIEEYKQEATYYIQSPSTLDGCDKTNGSVPWNTDSKIMPELQTEIDAGKENLCVEIILPFVGRLYSSELSELNFILTNLDTLSKFLEDNGAILEKNRNDVRKYISLNSIHIGANIPTSLIPKLVERDDVVTIDIYGKMQKIPWYVREGYDSKIMSELQNELDSGTETILIYINLPTIPMWPNGWPDPSTYPTREQIEQRRMEIESQAEIMQEPIISLLNDNNIEIIEQYLRINSIIVNVPASFIPELERLDDVVALNVFHEVITSFNSDTTSEKIFIPNESLDELLFDIVLDDNSAQLSIFGDAQNLKEIPVPDNVLGNEIKLLVNGVVENNFKIISSSTQTLLILQPILFQDTSIEENLPPISPKQQMKTGILPHQVICKDNMILVNKFFPRPPVCVTYHTALSLIERGVIHDVNWEKNAVNKATSFVLRNMDDDLIVTNGEIVTEIISARNSPVFSKISMFVNFTLYDKIRDNINQYSLIVYIRNGYVMTPEFIQTTTFNADTESWDKSLIPFNVSFFEDELNKQRIECERAEQMVQKRLEDNPLAIYGDRPVHTCHEFLEQWEQDYEKKLFQIDKNKENGIG